MNTKIKTQNQEFFRYEGSYSETFDFQTVHNYDPMNNYLLAQLSGLIYDTPEQIECQVNEWNDNTKDLNLELDIEDVESFRFIVLSNEEYVIIAFRGSENIGNWRSNINVALVPFENDGNLLVHRGFYDSVLLMGNKLNEIIAKRRKNKQNVYLTGHSLGGAQAILSAFISPEITNFTSVTTFGEPKIGSLELTTFLNKSLNSSPPSDKSRIYRNVNSMDLVPYFPIKYWFRDYYHESFFYIFAPGYGSKYQIETTGNPVTYTSVNNVPDEQHEIFGSKYNHHSITEYIDNARANKDYDIFDNIEKGY